MARSKRELCLCAAMALLCVIVIIVIIICVSVNSIRRCSDGSFKCAAVSADSETCSKVGRDVLQQGGSAVDGAIAALLCTSLLNPQSMGLGGGSIFTVRESSGKVKVINSRETVPEKFKPDLLKECNFQPLSGNQWIGIPGELRGYEEAHKLYGKLPWASLFQPAIRLAREGFPLPIVLSRYLPFINETTSPLWELFSDKNKTLLKPGDTLKYEKLADTLEIIANDGAEAFYTGKIASELIQDIQDAGGTLSMKDLKSFKVKVTDAWPVTLGAYRMYVPPPPAGGAILTFVLNIMKGYNLGPSSIHGDQAILTYHRYAEALKFANAQRKRSFVSATDAFQLTKEDFAEKVRGMINDHGAHDPQYYNITPTADLQGTTHLSVLAEDGSAVSVTSSINYIFGSKVYSPKTGVILNNQLFDFCGTADHISAGEQPPSSMSPVVLHSESQQRILVIGASGGRMITTGVALAIMNHLWFGSDLSQAIAAPVVFVDSEAALKFEPSFNKTVVEALKALGHKVKKPTIFYNVVNAVSKEESCIRAVSDARKMGVAAGY